MAGYGKQEVDHTGGLAKFSIRWYMGTESKVLTATDCKDFLGTMFAEKTNPIVILKVINVDDLADSWAEPRLKKYLAIES